ncbi:MAG TPA: hypothetical protein PLV68_19465 [Ilumatobacteraceae bacterium]|nr:hypothetical protein [Ilumatobacteraceae bacterium]
MGREHDGGPRAWRTLHWPGGSQLVVVEPLAALDEVPGVHHVAFRREDDAVLDLDTVLAAVPTTAPTFGTVIVIGSGQTIDRQPLP